MQSSQLATSLAALLSLLLPTQITALDLNSTAMTMNATTEPKQFARTNAIAVQYVWPNVSIAFLVIGTIANILSIIVFLRRDMRKYSSFCYFAVLNIINLAYLYTSLTRVILEFSYHTDIRQLNLFTCKAHVFITYFLGHFSSLLLSMISIDRVISVVFLHRAKQLCTPHVAFIVTLTLAALNFLISGHFIIFESGYYDKELIERNVTLNGVNSTEIVEKFTLRCSTRKDTIYQKFIIKVWKIVDMSLFAFIPFIIMATCSVIIIIRVAQQSKKFQKNSKSTRQPSKMVKKTETALDHDEASPMKADGKKSAGKGAEAKFSARTRNLALMLIPVNILFLVFLAPIVVAVYSYKKLGEDLLTLAILELLSTCNYTFNFFIYCATSSKFREELMKFVNELVASGGSDAAKNTNFQNLSVCQKACFRCKAFFCCLREPHAFNGRKSTDKKANNVKNERNAMVPMLAKADENNDNNKHEKANS